MTSDKDFNPHDARTWDDNQQAVYETGHSEGESCEGASWTLMLDEVFDIEASTPDEAKTKLQSLLNRERLEARKIELLHFYTWVQSEGRIHSEIKRYYEDRITDLKKQKDLL